MVHKKIRLKVPKSDQYQQKFTVDGNEFPVSPTIFQSLKYKILVSFFCLEPSKKIFVVLLV